MVLKGIVKNVVQVFVLSEVKLQHNLDFVLNSRRVCRIRKGFYQEEWDNAAYLLFFPIRPLLRSRKRFPETYKYLEEVGWLETRGSRHFQATPSLRYTND